jgi:hypothetical protein
MRALLPSLIPLLLLAPGVSLAQLSPQIPAAAQAMLQVRQGLVDASSPVVARASFDPPQARPGEKVFYRVDINATESAIQWPATLPAPAALKINSSARGQFTLFLGNTFRPQTTFLYEMHPAATGQFVITNFTVSNAGQPVEIPPATLDVVAGDFPANPPRQLQLRTEETNVFLGQPFHVEVLLPAGPGNQIEALREVHLNAPGLMTDEIAMRQSIDVISDKGELRSAFICELTVIPISAGPMLLSAQAFTAGREFGGPISIHGQVSLAGGPAKYVFLVSDPVALNVRPVPTEGQPAGFNGAIGVFRSEPPSLGTDRLQVGQPVHLRLKFHGNGDLTRFVPPNPPHSRDWQIIPDPAPATGFTLIPLTDEIQATPAIPFCSFDPITATYVDLSVPPIPVSVTGEGLPLDLRRGDQAADDSIPQRLSSFATAPGKSVSSLTPLQMQAWLVGIQLLPALGLFGLWQWDRHRRFLEAHPDLARRRKARRDLRRKRMELEKAAAADDADKFIRLAAEAMQIAVAPHYPANPHALVGADVLAQLDSAGATSQSGETVKLIFGAVDQRFALKATSPGDWLELKSEVNFVLEQLEEKL